MRLFRNLYPDMLSEFDIPSDFDGYQESCGPYTIFIEPFYRESNKGNLVLRYKFYNNDFNFQKLLSLFGDNTRGFDLGCILSMAMLIKQHPLDFYEFAMFKRVCSDDSYFDRFENTATELGGVDFFIEKRGEKDYRCVIFVQSRKHEIIGESEFACIWSLQRFLDMLL